MDFFSDELADHVAHFVHFGGEEKGFGLKGLFSAEGEELGGEAGGVTGGGMDVFDLVADVLGGVGCGDDEFGESYDGGEDVVEVVGDAGGELSECLHFL